MSPAYYVSMIRGTSRYVLLAGPFSTHDEALDRVEGARRLACGIDPWADFDLFGTCARPSGDRRGVLNTRLGIGAAS